MKTTIQSAFLLLIGILLIAAPAVTQVDVDVKDKTLRETDKRANKKTDDAIDQGFDKIEDGIGNLFGKKKKDKDKKESEPPAPADEPAPTETVTDAPAPVSQKDELIWSKYDFVPGDKVIFEDDLMFEENGEFPSRWDLVKGNTEIAEFNGEKVIMFRDGEPMIIPYFKEASKDYLPEVFTVEFDLYCGNDPFRVFLYDRKNQKSESPSGSTDLQIKYNEMEFGQSSSKLPEGKTIEKRRWVHVAIAYTNGKLKAYMDETRLINIPRIDFDPKGVTLYTYHARNDNLYYVKNIRIASGGVKYYDRIMEDGKIVAHGIRFDVNKATLKPESMGIINEVYGLMNQHPELNFSVEGHTDSDGDDALNLKLSEDRAKTVMDQLVSMGISSDRLSSKGMGETKPISDNTSPEGKANNRRVEFIKQ